MRGKPGCLTIAVVAVFAATAVAAAAPKVVIREWEVPTPNSRPHDPALAPDGALWYTGQAANRLGRLDPATGQIREFPLKTPDSGPHGLAFDREGNAWFTAVFKGYIGKLNPQTGEVTEYPMPDARAKDPHTPVFDRNGILWFTVEASNFVGRLDPRTGEIRLKQPPTRDAVPYGIVVSSQGVPYFCEFGTNKLASIDPQTLAITEYELLQGARPRRLALAPNGTIYYSDYARGYLGRFDPVARRIEEWPSPGGPGSHPYGIAVAPDGIVWYSESGVHPCTLVRFDPKTREFSTTLIASGGGVVRNMVATPDGKLYLACSGVNRVAIAYPMP
jgi:virginiamycin B lyase